MDTFGMHELRVLHIAGNENGSMLVSVSADENLKFWNIYDDKKVVFERVNINF
ncbi:WD repeat-containing protein slp1 [Gurleya vavrai]